jgi:hypothetical protein
MSKYRDMYVEIFLTEVRNEYMENSNDIRLSEVILELPLLNPSTEIENEILRLTNSPYSAP